MRKVSGMAAFAKSRHFANELRRAIDAHFEGNMTEFSRKSKVPLGTIAHYCRPGDDGRYPSAGQLEKLVTSMPRAARRGLLNAFVRDLVPPRIAADFELVDTKAKGGDPEITPVQGVALPDSTRDALEFLASLAAENRSVRIMIEQTARAMKG